jgi:hypothetical protein
MEERKIQNYIHLYPGCRIETIDGPGINLGHYWPDVWLKEGRIEPNGVVVAFPKKKGNRHGLHLVVMNYNQCVLRPIPLTRIKQEDAIALIKLTNSSFINPRPIRATCSDTGIGFYVNVGGRDLEHRLRFHELNPAQFHFLIQHGYDIFGIGDMKIEHIGRLEPKPTALSTKPKPHAKKTTRTRVQKKNAGRKTNKRGR